jgi:hypothetical protein
MKPTTVKVERGLKMNINQTPITGVSSHLFTSYTLGQVTATESRGNLVVRFKKRSFEPITYPASNFTWIINQEANQITLKNKHTDHTVVINGDDGSYNSSGTTPVPPVPSSTPPPVAEPRR